MPKLVEDVSFDTNLFDLKVGRLELNDEDMNTLQDNPSLDEVLNTAYSVGYRLIYIFGPIKSASAAVPTTPQQLPGKLVDIKTTYMSSIFNFDNNKLCKQAFMTSGIYIRKHELTKGLTSGLKELAIASGVWSRFKLDEGIPQKGFEGMFSAWISNSVNRTLADEIFIAYDGSDKSCQEEVGFITVKRRGDSVNIGLLAVSDLHRRRGIARALLSRAILWALEELGSVAHATINVVTQGENAAACACYEAAGFHKEILQEVYHVWLPEHLTSPLVRADNGPIPFCKQHLTGRESKYVTQVLSSGLDSAAHFTMLCTAKIKELLGGDSERVVMVPSGTAALEMAALLCELSPGDEVILPSYTFSSTANAFVLRGAIPVFIDIRADTLNIDETLIEAVITSRTKAICCVHYAGVPCEMDTICDIARRHNLYVIEDAAQGFMSTYKGRAIGTIGDFGCFSFHYTKNIICGEGGAISINRSRNLAARSLILWEKGTNRYDFMMGIIDKYHWIDMGSSFVPNELSCAVLWAQLEDAHTITTRRLANFSFYQTEFHELSVSNALMIPTIPMECMTNAHIFYILLPTERIREYYEKGLKERGISAYTHYIALHSAPAGLKYGRVVGSMAVTDRVQKVLLRLPLWIDMTQEQLQCVVDAVRAIAADIPAHMM